MAKAAKKQYIKDETARIEAIPILIKTGVITTWEDIFIYIPRTVVALHLGINNNRMKALMENPGPMPLEMQAKIAAFLKVEYAVLSALTFKALPVAKRVRKRN